MNDNDLKNLWQQQPLRDPAISPAQLISAVENKMTGLRRCLEWRDFRELAACAFIVIFFGISYFGQGRTPMSRLGDLIIIGSSIFIAFKLVYTRRTAPPAAPGATVIESLRAELKSVRAQSQLLGSVLWWYLLPLAIGILVGAWGNPGGLGVKIGYTAFLIALYGFIYWLNLRARSSHLIPLEAQLKSLIRSAETGEPLEETHVADLRPIVLSMAAAEHAKPVEFRVSFWQIAIFGMPGIVGIWFFLMIGLTMDGGGSKAKAQIPATFGQNVRIEDAARYSAVAQKVVDLLNDNNYAAVQSLYTSEMSKAFPPRQTSSFYDRLTARWGKIEKFNGPPGGSGGWIAYRLHCEKGELTMSLALDADNKIAGIYFAPTARGPMTFKSFVRELFSWQHLAWLPLFVVAGLLYCWLIQKLTNRAVGISSLGVHLSKGQNLILWDEIKDVQTMRFLHVRNLWLIRESGEKTLMHWTPLERRPDLKQAVESYAPANHPIRKHLPLLK